MSTDTLAKAERPKSTDGPFLLAILIGAKRTGDALKAGIAREYLESLGIKIRFAKDAPALRHGRKAVRHA